MSKVSPCLSPERDAKKTKKNEIAPIEWFEESMPSDAAENEMGRKREGESARETEKWDFWLDIMIHHLSI